MIGARSLQISSGLSVHLGAGRAHFRLEFVHQSGKRDLFLDFLNSLVWKTYKLLDPALIAYADCRRSLYVNCYTPIEQSFEKLVSCEMFDCGMRMSLGPMLFVDNLSTRLISSLKLACRSSPGDMSCWSISDLSAIVVRNFDGEALFCFARYWLNPAGRKTHRVVYLTFYMITIIVLYYISYINYSCVPYIIYVYNNR